MTKTILPHALTAVLVLSTVACAHKKTTPEAPAPGTAATQLPPRPWEKGALQGVTQTSLEVFGSKMVIRAWPSQRVPDTRPALAKAVAEIRRIESMVNPDIDTSEVAKINQGAWEGPVQISPELAQILIDCDRMFKFSQATFDVTFVPYKNRDKDFTDDEINKIKNWDKEPKLSANPLHLMGDRNLLLDQNPPRLRRYNRRTRLNLYGMIRGYTLERVSRILAPMGLYGFAIIADGLYAAAGIALQDPNLMCIENPNSLGTCIKQVRATDPSKVYFGGTSASLERRGKMYDPNATWSYRSGGITVAGTTGRWVQFALTYGGISDEGRLNQLFDKSKGLGLSGLYFDKIQKTQIIGSLAPYASY